MTKLGTTILKSVAADAVEIAQQLIDAGKDGIQLSDTVVVFTNLGKFQNVASNAKQALAELKDLTPDETEEVVEYVAARANLSDTDRVERQIKGSLRLVARTHRTVVEAVDIVADAQELFA